MAGQQRTFSHLARRGRTCNKAQHLQPPRWPPRHSCLLPGVRRLPNSSQRIHINLSRHPLSSRQRIHINHRSHLLSRHPLSSRQRTHNPDRSSLTSLHWQPPYPRPTRAPTPSTCQRNINRRPLRRPLPRLHRRHHKPQTRARRAQRTRKQRQPPVKHMDTEDKRGRTSTSFINGQSTLKKHVRSFTNPIQHHQSRIRPVLLRRPLNPLMLSRTRMNL